MSQIRDVVVVSGTRTAIGTYGGSLKSTPPAELAATIKKHMQDKDYRIVNLHINSNGQRLSQ